MWKDIVKTVAPVLGTAIGGPFGGMAVKKLASIALGEDIVDQHPAEELERKLDQISWDDPEILLQIKQADQSFEKEMKSLGVDVLKIDAEDRKSARQMAMGTTLKPQVILATVYVVAFATILYFVFSGKVNLDGPQADMANVLIGILSAGLVQIMNFFFGSSSGSKEKTAGMVK